MKALNTIALCLLMSIAFLSSANDGKESEGPKLRFEPTEINIGKVAVDNVSDDLGKIEFKIFNDGDQPLIVNQTTACCGTRVSDWPKQPIAPGQSGTIKIEFRVQPRPHRISRTVTVQSNACNGESLRVAILGEVVLGESEPNKLEL